VLTVEENVLQGGFGSAVLELLEERGLFSVQVKRLGLPDLFVEHGPQSLLRKRFGIDEEGIARKLLELVEEKWQPEVTVNTTQTSLPKGVLRNLR
jgi:1-deoxy-D-xylulose-5-phosphate synthase